MTPCLSILRFGSPEHAGMTGDFSSAVLPCQRLTDRLMEHFASLESSSSETSNDPSSSSVLQISNRYFAASVALRLQHAGEQTHTTTQSNDDDDQPHKEDGIVLVWYEDHVHTPEDFTQLLNSVHDKLEAAGGGDLLRLCVAVESASTISTTTRQRPKTPKEAEEEYAKRVLWCLDRGYEYIPACDLSDEGVRRGHGERDKEGFARLVEAIQGTVWSSAVMATSTQRKLKSAYQETIAAVEQSDENNENDDDRVNQYVPPDPTMLQTSMSKEADAERERNAQQSLLKVLDEHDAVEGNDNIDEVVAHPEADLPNERLLNQFEGAIQEASRIRDMSRSGQLSDEERRQRAGDAAMMLVNLLDQMGYDDEDEHDDEGSSDGDEEKEEKVD